MNCLEEATVVILCRSTCFGRHGWDFDGVYYRIRGLHHGGTLAVKEARSHGMDILQLQSMAEQWLPVSSDCLAIMCLSFA